MRKDQGSEQDAHGQAQVQTNRKVTAPSTTQTCSPHRVKESSGSPLFSGQSPIHATSPLLIRFHTPDAGLHRQGSDLRALTLGHLMSPL